MNRSPFKLKLICAAIILSALLTSLSGCALIKPETKEAAVIEGTLWQSIKVDSEHGLFDGVFSEEIIYDAYLNIPYSLDDKFVLWVTRETKVYNQHDVFKPIPFEEVKGGAKVRAHVGEIDKSGSLPGAYAVKLIIFE